MDVPTPQVVVEVVHAGQRHDVVERAVLERAAGREQLARVHALLHCPRPVSVTLEVAEALIRVTQHLIG